jgi:hypothetical protein
MVKSSLKPVRYSCSSSAGTMESMVSMDCSLDAAMISGVDEGGVAFSPSSSLDWRGIIAPELGSSVFSMVGTGTDIVVLEKLIQATNEYVVLILRFSQWEWHVNPLYVDHFINRCNRYDNPVRRDDPWNIRIGAIFMKLRRIGPSGSSSTQPCTCDLEG